MVAWPPVAKVILPLHDILAPVPFTRTHALLKLCHDLLARPHPTLARVEQASYVTGLAEGPASILGGADKRLALRQVLIRSGRAVDAARLCACLQAPLPDPEDALQAQQTALRHSLAEPSDQSQSSAAGTSSSKKHKPGNWAGQ